MWLADVVALPPVFATIDSNKPGPGGSRWVGTDLVMVSLKALLWWAWAPALLCGPVAGLTDLTQSLFLQTGWKWLWGMVSPVLHCQQEGLLKMGMMPLFLFMHNNSILMSILSDSY